MTPVKPPDTKRGGWLSTRRARVATSLLIAVGVLGGLAAAPSYAQTRIFSVAGSGVVGSNGDDGLATLADLNYPRGLTALPDGGFLVTEAFGDRVRKVTADGEVVPFAGSGVRGFGGDGGPATAAKFNLPHGTVLLPDGRVLIADTNNFRIRAVALDGTISTVAGTGTRTFGGDGGPATAARISAPRGIGGTGDGGYLIADSDNDRIRRVSPAGQITTVAGNGTRGFSGDGGPATAAALNAPYGVSALPDGSFYIAESGNHRIRRVAPDGTITTVAGTGAAGFSGDGGQAVLAQLNTPHAVEATPDGRLLIADMGNHRVREVGADGIIRTAAGTGTAGFSGEAGTATDARLFYPKAVLSFGSGLLIADSDNNRVRYLGPSPWPAPAAGSGIVFLNGAEPFANSPLVSVASPAEGVTQVRISNSPAVTNGVLTSGTTYPYSTPIAWDLTDPATGGSAAQGRRLVYVQWDRGGGDWSAIRADSIVLDTVAPTTSEPATSFRVGSSIGSSLAATPVPVAVSWSGADATSGVASYDLSKRADSGGPAVSTTSDTTVNDLLAAGTQYSFGVRATDRAGNVGAWAGGTTAFSASLTQESDPALVYAGTWASEASATASGGATRWTNDPSASVAFTFTGRAVAWVAPVGAAGGTADVEVDGVNAGTVNLNASTPGARRIVYAKAWSTTGQHTITITNAGTSTRMDVDAFLVGTASPSPPTDATAPETTVTSGPVGTTTATGASFGFVASEPGASFECQLSGPGTTTGGWTPCSSPKGYSALAYGTYTFSVRATDQAGNTDASPATRSFSVAAPEVPGGTGTTTDPGNGNTGGGSSGNEGNAEIVGGARASRTPVGANGSFSVANVLVKCTGAGPACAGKISVIGSMAGASATRRSVTLGGSTFTLGSGKSVRIKSKLTRKGLRLLKRAKRIQARVVIKIQRGSAAVTKTVRITLTAPRSRSAGRAVLDQVRPVDLVRRGAR